jgi:hypothetical protein
MDLPVVIPSQTVIFQREILESVLQDPGAWTGERLVKAVMARECDLPGRSAYMSKLRRLLCLNIDHFRPAEFAADIAAVRRDFPTNLDQNIVGVWLALDGFAQLKRLRAWKKVDKNQARPVEKALADRARVHAFPDFIWDCHMAAEDVARVQEIQETRLKQKLEKPLKLKMTKCQFIEALNAVLNRPDEHSNRYAVAAALIAASARRSIEILGQHAHFDLVDDPAVPGAVKERWVKFASPYKTPENKEQSYEIPLLCQAQLFIDRVIWMRAQMAIPPTMDNAGVNARYAVTLARHTKLLFGALPHGLRDIAANILASEFHPKRHRLLAVQEILGHDHTSTSITYSNSIVRGGHEAGV